MKRSAWEEQELLDELGDYLGGDFSPSSLEKAITELDQYLKPQEPAMKQVRLNLTSVTVQHREPEALSGGRYSLVFWLRLTVESPMGEGGGTSPSVSVTIYKPSIEMARAAAFAIEEVAQKSIEGKDFGEVLQNFPRLIKDLASQEP